ncbi:hypothetical protein DFH11DRAFT_1723684 [Phellopilus nigrolimitatus]|nr:hypothetical protein DFH11DRAFT_1723684 [Phellopilus nigrolimitatus]
MSIRRRSTVHDLASLRLHPDGSRVQPGPGPSQLDVDGNGFRVNGTTRLSKYNARDAHGNWIARDAGGFGAVKQRRRGRKGGVDDDKEGKGKGKNIPAGEEEETFDLDITANASSQRELSSVKSDDCRIADSSADDVEDGLKDVRAKKRKKFYHDFSFLDALHSHPNFTAIPRSIQSNALAGPSSQPIHSHEADYYQINLSAPSSDLLKCIHHFASEYYSANGCLFDAAREARRQRKERKLRKLEKRARRQNEEPVDDDQDSQLDFDGSSKSNGNDMEEDDENRNSDGVADSGKEKRSQKYDKKKKGRSKGDKEKMLRRDMYKAFDGSALMAIGMLLQEHVVQMMSAKPSEEWERQMLIHEADEGKVRGGRRVRKKASLNDGGQRHRRQIMSIQEQGRDKAESAGGNDGKKSSADGSEDGEDMSSEVGLPSSENSSEERSDTDTGIGWPA